MSTVSQRQARSPTGRVVGALVSLAIAALVAAWSGRAPVAPPASPSTTRTAQSAPLDTPRAQIDRVVDSMLRTGHPPAGIAQGGRHGGDRGVFENAEGRLPAQPRGYYAETDVWPRGPDGRGAERLIFGRTGEVWYSPDHYRSFERVR